MPVIKAFATCLLTGANFSPKRLSQITGLRFESPSEKGDLNYQGKKYLHGGASITIPYHINQRGKYIELDTMLQVLLMHKEHMEACGVETIYLTLNFFCKSDIASWHLEHEQLEKIVNLGSGLSLDWYQFDEDEELDDKEKV